MRPRKYTARKKRPSISVSAECFAKIERAAKQLGITPNAFVEERIRQFLDRKGVN